MLHYTKVSVVQCQCMSSTKPLLLRNSISITSLIFLHEICITVAVLTVYMSSTKANSQTIINTAFKCYISLLQPESIVFLMLDYMYVNLVSFTYSSTILKGSPDMRSHLNSCPILIQRCLPLKVVAGTIKACLHQQICCAI